MSEDGENDMLFRKAAFGEQVESFFTSDIGKYILGRAFEESESAMVDLVKCDPDDVKQVRSLQNKVMQANNLKSWLEQAVTDGLKAINILEDRG